MSIINAPKTADHISNWIKDYADRAGIKTLVVDLDGGVDSALTALLCKRTGLDVFAITSLCYSANLPAFVKDYDIPLTEIAISPYSHSICKQFNQCKPETVYPEEKIVNPGLIATILSLAAKNKNGLIVGHRNKSDNFVGNYHKHGDICDIAPIIDLFKSEIYELFVYLAHDMRPTKGQEEKSIGKLSTNSNYIGNISAIPRSAIDILYLSNEEVEKELGLTYAEIEWAIREDDRTTTPIPHQGDHLRYWPGILLSEKDPVKHPAWLGYTGRQKAIIAKIHQMEKLSKHKADFRLPTCWIRSVDGLTR